MSTLVTQVDRDKIPDKFKKIVFGYIRRLKKSDIPEKSDFEINIIQKELNNGQLVKLSKTYKEDGISIF